MSELTWGDTVRINTGAPESARPGATAEIVGIRNVESSAQARQFQATIGSKVYLVEFGDGGSVEIPEAWIDAAKL